MASISQLIEATVRRCDARADREVLVPDHDLASCPPIDILVVAGGIDPSTQMTDEAVMAWMREAGQSAEYVTSVCTGALILAEAGLLDGYRATTHWAYKQQLATYPVEVVDDRVVSDRNRITGGGVTAGIDFGLALVAQVAGADVAAGLQLMGEYDRGRDAVRQSADRPARARRRSPRAIPGAVAGADGVLRGEERVAAVRGRVVELGLQHGVRAICAATPAALSWRQR
ncbi:MAG: cyclohexyl-isocyanide hydratase [Solirubrobacteraceae bacterium]|nr:cyclohexyl-isocyanide hydratase [Solirubrobacteraceae bacterium]